MSLENRGQVLRVLMITYERLRAGEFEWVESRQLAGSTLQVSYKH